MALGGIEEAAHLISLRLASLEGQAKVHVYVVQELVCELRSLCDRPGHEQLGQLCRESFGRIGWDWGTNQPRVVPPGMLMGSADVQRALREITTSAGVGGEGGPNVFHGKGPVDEGPKTWQCVQSLDPLGATDAAAGNFVSTIEFDKTGNFLACANRVGRIFVWKRNTDYDAGATGSDPFLHHCEFQSHSPEFDYLKSLEIEERIHSVRWCPQERSDSHTLLATNDKTIKLWKLKGNDQVTAKPRKTFSNGHIYHINSLSVCSDGETFLSSDDLRINVWHTECSNECFNMVDLKPSNMDDLSEVITAAEYHPTSCNIFIYGSSKGCVRMGDMRDAALCDAHSKSYQVRPEAEGKSFFSEIISSVSDIKFSNDGTHILSRDFMTLKLWDVRIESKPVSVVAIHDHLRAKLCELYENDCIFDKFECALSNDGGRVITGSYDHRVYIHNTAALGGGSTEIELAAEGTHVMHGNELQHPFPQPGRKVDFDKKSLHVASSPCYPMVAVGATSAVHLYSYQNAQPK